MIYAFSMHVLRDFAMCLDELSYTFDHIWTNLLTQCTKLPVPVFCYFCISGFPAIKVPNKFWKNYIKNQRPGSLRKHQGRKGGPPPGLQKGPWRGPTLGRARHPLGCLVAPLGAPFGLYLGRAKEIPKIKVPFPEAFPISAVIET